jgi:hypothetical protein
MTHLYVTNGQVTWVWTVSIIQYVKPYTVAKHKSHRNMHHNDQANLWQAYPSMNVCQINQSWKQHHTYSLGSLYNAQLLTNLSNTPVTFTLIWIFICNMLSTYLKILQQQCDFLVPGSAAHSLDKNAGVQV